MSETPAEAAARFIRAAQEATARVRPTAKPTIGAIAPEGPTPHRTFRIPDEEYTPARLKAKGRGETVTDVVRRKLREYIQEEDD